MLLKKFITFPQVRNIYISKHRLFHETMCLHLRKASSNTKRKNLSEESSYNQEPLHSFQMTPPLSNENFYGVENDYGVINIEDKESTSVHSVSLLSDSDVLEEKFRATKFGKVRYDSQNKLVFHGQYETNNKRPKTNVESKNNEYYKIPNKYMEQLLLFKGNKNVRKDQVKADSTVDTKKSSANNSEPLVQSCKLKSTPSFIDEQYFENNLTKSVPNESIQFETHKKDMSFIDDLYFNNESGSSFDKNVKPNSSSASLDNLTDSSSHKKIDFALSEQIGESAAPVSGGKISFFDEQYFNTVTNDDPNKNENLPFFNKQDSSVELSFNSAEISEANQNSFQPENSRVQNPTAKSESFKTRKVEKDSILQIGKSQNKIIKNSNMKPLVYNEPLFDISNKELLSPNATSKVTIHDVEEDSTSTVSSLQSISSEKTNLTKGKPFIQDQKIKDSVSKQVEKKDGRSAFDYVSELRKKSAPLPKERVPLFTEKHDSKGFRILRYQVPNLMQYTRDEILDMLTKNVLYSDDDIVVLNKPYNLIMHESNSSKEACLSQYLDDLAQALDKQNSQSKLYTVHRLDKETTGCLLLARNEDAAIRLKSLFAQRKINKCYWIVTSRVPDPLEGVIDIPISEGSIEKKARMVLNPNVPENIKYKSHSRIGKRAVTQYKVIAVSGSAALVAVYPETGIKHQIRVHFGFGLSCPILGDHKYSHLKKLAPQKLDSDLLQRLYIRQSKVRYIPIHIYARSIMIPAYSEGRNLFVQAPMPYHMSKNLQRLKFKKNL